jgi:hypothetical protein
VEVGDLAEQVAAWETEDARAELESDDRKRVYISLIQHHLPAMADADVVALDEEEGLVRLTEAAADIDIYIEVIPDDDIVWGEYYLGLAALCGGFLAIVWLDVYPFTEFGDTTWFALVVGLFVVSAVVHFLYQRRFRLGNAGPPPEFGA